MTILKWLLEYHTDICGTRNFHLISEELYLIRQLLSSLCLLIPFEAEQGMLVPAKYIYFLVQDQPIAESTLSV